MTWGSELRDTPSNTVVRSTLAAWAISLTMLTGVGLVSAQEAAPASVEATDQPADAEISEAPPPQADPASAVLEYEPAPEDQITADDVVSFPVDI